MAPITDVRRDGLSGLVETNRKIALDQMRRRSKADRTTANHRNHSVDLHGAAGIVDGAHGIQAGITGFINKCQVVWFRYTVHCHNSGAFCTENATSLYSFSDGNSIYQ